MKYKFLLIGIVFGLLLSNCSKEEEHNFNKKSNKSAINFNIKSIDTKTEYKEDGFSMRWTTGDAVTIFCDQAKTVKKSNYDVVVNGDSKTTLVVRDLTDETQLFWGGMGVDHQFYAVYPAEDNDRVRKDGNFLTLKINSELSGALDMKNAYLVADNIIKRQGEDPQVDLLFKPIMTTYDVTIQNKCNKAATVYQIFFSYKDTKGYIKDGTFKYDLTTRKAVEGFGETGKKVKFVYSINNLFGQTLAAGATITFKMFLPPIEDISASNPLEVKVSGTVISSNQSIGGAEITTTCGVKGDITTSIAKSKASINIGLKETNNNNWIEDLDDETPITELSILGAAFAGTSYQSGGYGVQLLNINQLWDFGVRAFDFHGDVTSNGWHQSFNYITTSRNGYEAYNMLEDLSAKLASNNKEFAIVFYRIEYSGVQLNSTTQNRWKDLVSRYWSKSSIAYRPDLKVKDLRGKILMIGLEWGTRNLSDKKFSGNVLANGWAGQYASAASCYTTRGTKEGTIYAASGGTNGQILSHDYANFDVNTDFKQADIENQLNMIANPANNNKLSVIQANCFYTGNYNTDMNASGFGFLVNQRLGGRKNLEEVFKHFYGKSSFGIVMLPFVGAKSWKNGQYPVYGDVLPSIIIANNFILNK